MSDETPEQELKRLSQEIPYHRGKAISLRKRADGQDQIADDKVRRCAALQTKELELEQPNAAT